MGEKMTQNTLAIYCHYSENEIIDDYVIYGINSLYQIGYDILFYTTCSTIRNKEKIKFEINFFPNFGSGTDLLILKDIVIEKSKIINYEWILFLNDSILFPINGVDIFKKTIEDNRKKSDFWGHWCSNEYQLHLCSCFLEFNIKVIEKLANFLSSFNPDRTKLTKQMLIDNIELNILKELSSHGFKYSSVIPLINYNFSKSPFHPYNFENWINNPKCFAIKWKYMCKFLPNDLQNETLLDLLKKIPNSYISPYDNIIDKSMIKYNKYYQNKSKTMIILSPDKISSSSGISKVNKFLLETLLINLHNYNFITIDLNSGDINDRIKFISKLSLLYNTQIEYLLLFNHHEMIYHPTGISMNLIMSKLPRKKTYIYTFWELSVLHDNLFSLLKYVDVILVSSYYCHITYSKYIVNHNKNIDVKYIRYCNYDYLPSIKYSNNFREELGWENKIVFLFIFSFHSDENRKNPEGLIDLFLESFKYNDDVRLLIKSSPGGIHFKNEHKYMDNILLSDKIEKCDKKIFHLKGFLGNCDIDKLYNTTDFYIQCHRSEGLGLSFLDAMERGIYCISTDYTGPREFLTNENSTILKSKIINVEFNDYLNPVYKINNAQWVDVEIKDSLPIMKSIYNNIKSDKNYYKSMGDLIKESVRKYYKWNYNKMINSIFNCSEIKSSDNITRIIKTKQSTDNKIIFIHTCFFDRAEEIIISFYNMICESGLIDECVSINVIYCKEREKTDVIDSLKAKTRKIFFTAIDNEDNIYDELVTNNYIQEFAINNDTDYKILKLQCKGEYNISNENDNFRNNCSHRLIYGWKKCIKYLDYVDVVCTFLRVIPRIHSSGNFYWTTSEHLRKLPKQRMLNHIMQNYFNTNSNFEDHTEIQDCNRYDSEFWIGFADAKMLSIYENNKPWDKMNYDRTNINFDFSYDFRYEIIEYDDSKEYSLDENIIYFFKLYFSDMTIDKCKNMFFKILEKYPSVIPTDINTSNHKIKIFFNKSIHDGKPIFSKTFLDNFGTSTPYNYNKYGELKSSYYRDEEKINENSEMFLRRYFNNDIPKKFTYGELKKYLYSNCNLEKRFIDEHLFRSFYWREPVKKITFDLFDERFIDISIVVCVKDRNEGLYAFLKSLISYDNNFSYEVICIDDCSEIKNSNEILTKFNNITYIRNNKNKRYSSSINNGIKIAKGKFIFMATDDIILQPNTMNILFETIKRNEKYAIVSPLIIYGDNIVQESGSIVHPSGITQWISNYESKCNFDYLREVEYISLTGCLVRKNIIKDGYKLYYDNNGIVLSYYEDVNMCFEVRNRGFKVILQPACKLIHLHISYPIKKDIQIGDNTEIRNQHVELSKNNFLKLYSEQIPTVTNLTETINKFFKYIVLINSKSIEESYYLCLQYATIENTLVILNLNGNLRKCNFYRDMKGYSILIVNNFDEYSRIYNFPLQKINETINLCIL